MSAVEIVVEDGIPITKRMAPDRTIYDWPFARMKVGQSFELPVGHRKSLYSAITRFHRRNPDMRLTMRTLDGFVRCWRIK